MSIVYAKVKILNIRVLTLFLWCSIFFNIHLHADLLVKPASNSTITHKGALRQGVVKFTDNWRDSKKIRFNLFPDITLDGTVTQQEAISLNSTIYQGKIENDSQGHFIISDVNGLFNVRIATKGIEYKIVWNTTIGNYEVIQSPNVIHGFKCDQDHHVTVTNKAVRSKANTAAVKDPADNKTILSVGLIATQSALDHHYQGNEDAFVAHLHTQIAEINKAYDNSLIALKLVLAGYRVTTYVDTDHELDLAALSDSKDADVVAKRDQLHTVEGADMVAILGKVGGGLGNVGMNRPYMSAGVKSGWYVLGHEWGHNFGCQHDKYTDGDKNIHNYNNGWLFYGTNGQRYNTIMGYIQDTEPYQGFSNPDIMHMGTATGHPVQANSARKINEVILEPGSEKHNKAPIVGITLPKEGISYAAAGGMNLKCTAIDLDSTIAKVEYIVNNKVIATSTSKPFSAIWATPTIGNLTITAKATDRQDATKTSEPINFIVTESVEPNFSLTSMSLIEGEVKSYNVILNGVPGGDVTFTMSSVDTKELTVSPKQLVFNESNWNVAQTVNVKAVDDIMDEIEETHVIQNSWTGTGFSGSQDINIKIFDNDTSSFTVSVADSKTSESGDQGAILVVLNTQPNANVVVSANPDAKEGKSINTLTFTPSNWNSPQSLFVKGVDDKIIDGDVKYNVIVNTKSTDPNYNNLSKIVELINADNEINPIFSKSNINLREGQTSSYNVVLNVAPIEKVTIVLSLSNSTDLKISQNSLTFTPANWNIPQRIQVTAIDDDLDEDDESMKINHNWTVDGLSGSQTITTTVEDNDTAGFEVVIIDGVTTEAGGKGKVKLVLNSQPTANVTIVAHPDANEAKALNQITFSPSNWNNAQFIELSGVDDADLDGNVKYKVSIQTNSSDPKYKDLEKTINMKNMNDEVAGIHVTSRHTPLYVEEGGALDHLNISLTVKPNSPVIIHLSSDEDLLLSENTILFDENNYQNPQIIQVTALEDTTPEFTKTSNIYLKVDKGAKDGFQLLTLENVLVTVKDLPPPKDTEITETINDITIRLDRNTENTSETDITTTISDIYKISNGDLSSTQKETILTYLDRSLENNTIQDLPKDTSLSVLSTLDSLFPNHKNISSSSPTQDQYKITISVLENVTEKSNHDHNLVNMSIDILGRLMQDQQVLLETDSAKLIDGSYRRSMDTTFRKLALSNSKLFTLEDASNLKKINLESVNTSLIQQALDPNKMGQYISIHSPLANLDVTIPKSAINGPSVASIITVPLNPYDDLDKKYLVSMLVHIDIYDINTKSLRKVERLLTPIELNFGVNLSSYDTAFTGLRYFDEQQQIWSASGISNESINPLSNRVRARVDHLTPFAVISGSKSNNVSITGRSQSDQNFGTGGCLFNRVRSIKK